MHELCSACWPRPLSCSSAPQCQCIPLPSSVLDDQLSCPSFSWYWGMDVWRGVGGEVFPQCCPCTGTAWFPSVESPTTALPGLCPGKHTLMLHYSLSFPPNSETCWKCGQAAASSASLTCCRLELSRRSALFKSPALLSQVHVTEKSRLIYSCRN